MVWHLPEVTCVHVFLNFYINIFYLIQSPKYFLLDVLWFWEYISILRSISLMCDETMAWPQWLLWRKIFNSNNAAHCGPVGPFHSNHPIHNFSSLFCWKMIIFRIWISCMCLSENSYHVYVDSAALRLSSSQPGQMLCFTGLEPGSAQPSPSFL